MTVPTDEQLPAGYRFVTSPATGGIVRLGGPTAGDQPRTAAVYLAVNEVLDRQVAVKVVPSGRVVDRWSAASSVREAQTLAQLNHPNIVRVYDLVTRGDVDLIVMELVAGGTLTDLIGASEPGRAVRLRLLAETAAGLGYLHRAGVVHRDIKPGNVLVSATGVAKIADFGLVTAAVVTEDPLHTEIDRAVAGTPGHWSPEQARGEGVGPSSDVYSLATVAVRLLGDRAGDTNRPRVRRRLQVADVLARCLHPDPFARPHDGDEMYQLLSAAADDEDVDWRHAQWQPARRQLAATDAAESEEELETIAPDRPVNAATAQHSSPMPTAPPPPSPPPPIERLVVQPRAASDVTVARSRRMSRRARRVLLVLVGAAVGVFIGLVLSSHL